MKKIIAVILSFVMVFLLVACGNEPTAENESKEEKYCFNCGEGISKAATFCEHCGTDVKNTNSEGASNDNISSDNTSSTSSKDSKPAESSKPATSSKPSSSSANPSSSQTAESSKPSTPTHTHNYTNKTIIPTCTEKGYTLHTCSCGDTYKDNYINPEHSYLNYRCSICGAIDKEHAYEYLETLVILNGTLNTETGNIDYIYKKEEKEYSDKSNTYTRLSGLSYDSARKDLVAWDYFDWPNSPFSDDYYGWISLNDYYCKSLNSYGSVSGYIDPSTFKYDPRNQDVYLNVHGAVLELAIFLQKHTNYSIDIADLGFTSV